MITLVASGGRVELTRSGATLAWIRRYRDGGCDGSWRGERKAHTCWTAAMGWLAGVATIEAAA